MTITCATYNILHGYHRELVLKNIRFLIDEGADVICLQEAEGRFKGALPKLLVEKRGGCAEIYQKRQPSVPREIPRRLRRPQGA